jgi:hypothetical protein
MMSVLSASILNLHLRLLDGQPLQPPLNFASSAQSHDRGVPLPGDVNLFLSAVAIDETPPEAVPPFPFVDALNDAHARQPLPPSAKGPGGCLFRVLLLRTEPNVLLFSGGRLAAPPP